VADLVEHRRQLLRTRGDLRLQRLVEQHECGVRGIELTRALDRRLVKLGVVDPVGDLIADDRQQHLIELVERVRRSALDAEDADETILHHQRNAELALGVGETGHFRCRLQSEMSAGFHARPHTGDIGKLRADITHAYDPLPPRGDPEDSLPDRDCCPGLRPVIAAACRHMEDRLIVAGEQDHAVSESQHRVHRFQADGEDAVELERRADLRGDLLDDPNLIGLARERGIEAVDDRLILDHLLAEGRCDVGRGGHACDLDLRTDSTL
jgi:hypothetical protein